MTSAEDSLKYILPTYGRLPVCLVKGKGVYLWDESGKKYLDFFAGLAVDNLGHCPESVVKALSEQLQTLFHVSNVFVIREQVALAKKLTELSGLHQAFFCNSGTEAVEACLKFARHWGVESKGPDCYEVIAMEKSFHGRSMGSLSATMQEKYQSGFGPLVPGFHSVPHGDLNAIKSKINHKTCAVIIEPIQGEGGVRMLPKGFLEELRKICDEKNILLILDEVQVGLARTGKLFAFQHTSIKPDLLALSKALGSGFPVGACLANEKVAQFIKPGIHASTFGGAPLACRAALATLDIVSKEDFLKNVSAQSEYFLQKLKGLEKKHLVIKEVRGQGLMLACELNQDVGQDIVMACLEQGLLINCIQGKILRFVPPLIITHKNIDEAIEILDEVLLERSAS